jgi:hypothetical protein
MKTKYEFLKVKNLNLEGNGTKFKLLKPKVMSSNGAKVKEVKASSFSELLKNPKVKFPLKTIKKSNEKSFTNLEIETTQLTNKTDDNTLIYNQSKFESNTLEGNPHKIRKLKQNDSNLKNLHLDESEEKHVRYYNKEPIYHNKINYTNCKNENEGEVIENLPFTFIAINHQSGHNNKKSKKKKQKENRNSGDSNIKNYTNNCEYYGNNFRQKSSINKTTLNVAEAFNQTIQVKEISKLRHAKSMDKIKGIKIIDDIIQGLSQLKTIIANQEDEFECLKNNKKDQERKTINYDYNEHEKISNKTKKNKNKKCIESLNKSYCSSNSNRLLISSTSGNLIEIKNKNIFNLMKNKTINHKTIENERNRSSSFKKLKNIKTLKTLNSSIDNVESMRKCSKNEKKTLDVNESLIMKIKGKGKPVAISRKDEISISNESNVSFDNNLKKREKNKKVKRLKIENTFNREYSSITPNNRFQIDKFEYKVLNPVTTNNKNETSFFDISSKKKEKGIALLPDRRYSNSSLKSKKEKNKEKLQTNGNERKEVLDEFANYIFSD